MPNGDDGMPATKGDIRRVYKQIGKLPNMFKEEMRDQIRLHSAECPARDVHHVQQQVREGKLAPIVREHPIAAIGGGGTLVGIVVTIALKALGV